MKFILMDIGCIECGESSDLLGVFDSKEEAESIASEWSALGWRGGQHSYDVFELSDNINELGKKSLESAKKEASE
jgi:hypothetical protein